MDPHSSQIVTKKVEQRVPRQKAEGIGNPVSLVWIVIVVRLIPLPQFPNRLRALIIRTGPNSQRDSVECMAGILLENECMMDTMRLCAACTYFDIVGEASLHFDC